MDQLIKTYTKHLGLPYIHQNLSFHLEQARLENQSHEEFRIFFNMRLSLDNRMILILV